eukprot:673107-Pelagomonas_calceolata.AAC.5
MKERAFYNEHSRKLLQEFSGFCQRGSAKHAPKYAPFLHLKCTHSQPLHLIGTILALKCIWQQTVRAYAQICASCPMCLDRLG